MPFPYTFDFSQIATYAQEPTWIKRYKFSIDPQYEDFWDTPIANPPPITRPIFTARLTTTDLTSSVNWSSKDGAGTTHSPDSVFSASSIAPLPNIFGQIYEITNPAQSPDISQDRGNEINGKGNGAGGVGVSAAGTMIDFRVNPVLDASNTFDAKPMVEYFMQNARTSGATAFNVIIHAKNDMVGSTAEYLYVPGSTIEGIHNAEFYKTSAYVAFNSKESNITTANPVMASRRSLRWVYFYIPSSSIEGISMSDQPNAIGYFQLNNIFTILSFQVAVAWDGTPKQMRINQYPQNNEGVVASRIEAQGPNAIECVAKLVTLTNITADGKIVFQNGSVNGSLFSNDSAGYNLSGVVAGTNTDFGLESPNRYQLEGVGSVGFALRVVSAGPQDKYYIEGIYNNDPKEVRFFESTPGQSNINIEPNSFIRLQFENSADTRNGIYRVLSIQDGIPNDPWINLPTSATNYQYLEVQYIDVPVTSAFPNTTIIENISNLPVLAVKYRQTI